MNDHDNYDMCSILKEYLTHHDKYLQIYGPKTVILMLVGKFYECYAVINETIQIGADLNKISDILNIQIARRNKKIKEITYDNFLMAGFPEIALIKYRNILLNHGYTIVMVNQISAPPNPERAVTEIISPSTIIDTFNNEDSHHLLSLYINIYPAAHNKKIYCIGVSAINISTGKNYVHRIQSTMNDNKLWKDEAYRILHYYNPSELIIHYPENEVSLTIDEISQLWSIDPQKIHLNLIDSKQYLKPSYQNMFLKKIFQNTNTLSPIEYLGFEMEKEITLSYIYMLQFIYEHKIENIQNIQLPMMKENNDFLILTHNCIHQLYVTESKEHSSEQYNSLLSIVNKCNTAIGRRLCKERILYPILDESKLNERYKTVEDFQQNSNDKPIYELCRSYLKKIIDIEKLHRRMGLQIIHPYEFNSLHVSYQYIQKIHELLIELLPDFSKSFLITHQKMDEYMNRYTTLFDMNEIEKWSLDKIETSVFNPTIYPEIDELNNQIKNKKAYLDCICRKLSSYIDKKEVVKLDCNDKYGWYIHMTKNRAKILSKSFQNLQQKLIQFKHTNGKVFLSLDVADIKLVTRASDIFVDVPYISTLSNELFTHTRKLQSLTKEKYLQNIEKLYSEYDATMNEIVNYVGLVDLNSNNAKISIENGYCRPTILNQGNESYIDAKDIRHPIVEKIQTDIPYVPNDVQLCKDGILLYGTNACGKSTFMKSIGLTIILAQAGFYVPCSSFTYYPYTQLFTRILNNDNIFRGQSSFAIEMSELRSILLRANERSLVLGDELCSGTENISALSIVAAGLKTLGDMKCSFIFTSHLHQLMDISLIRDIQNLHIYHLKIIYDQEKDLLIYDRKLEKGSGPAIYGLEVCKAMDLGNEFISLARSIQLTITDSTHNLLNDKQSNYNKDIVMDQCQVCFKKSEHTHHIQEQNEADANGMIHHYHKNTKHNLVPLCETCHHKVHNENLRIYGYHKTNEGIHLKYEYLEQNQVINHKKKFSEKQVKTIMQYKQDIHDKKLKKSHCIKKLELDHHIQISVQTLNKILNEEY